MADSTIIGLATDRTGSAAADDYYVVQHTGTSTRAEKITFAGIGGLEHNAQTVTGSDITGAVGQFYYCTIAGLTADRNLTLPASANVGERIGVYIVDGDDTDELIIKGAATVTINGGSAATEWSRLFIQDECVIFRATSSTNWVVEYDGRIPSYAELWRSTSTTSNPIPNNTHTKVTFDTATAAKQRGDIDDLTNDRITPRRAGAYYVYGSWNTDDTIFSGDVIVASIGDDAATPNLVNEGPKFYPNRTDKAQGMVNGMFVLASSDVGTTAGYITLLGYQDSGSSVDIQGISTKKTRLQAFEIL